MPRFLEIFLPPSVAFNEELLPQELIRAGRLTPAESYRIRKRSVDARSRNIRVRLDIEIFHESEVPPPLIGYRRDYEHVGNKPPVVVVGAGPAGLFAALKLIELGLKPIILERGKDVRSRRRDLAAINKEHVVNPESNYCFGEGGAGTYSDGKLYTRSDKRGDVRRILEILTAHGAREEILYDAHPHIGTNKLPNIVTALRNTIIEAGGEVLFDTKVTDFMLSGDRMTGVVTASGDKIEGLGVILATGHSARDIFELLERKNIYIEVKPFALGVRVEHPQELIDRIQYRCNVRGDYLPAASYALVAQTLAGGIQRGVYSFCMCPGGFIVPSATAPGEVVVNGMSPSRRDSRYANSGIVVAVEREDLKNYASFGALAALQFQRETEQRACSAAGGTQRAPAQRLTDFLKGKVSASLPTTSYQPGLTSVDLYDVLQRTMADRLREAFTAFGKKMRGYVTEEAQIVGVESRTSSPVRILRNKETFEHVYIKNLFPCGEGAGYAGGIVSAALDGERCAWALNQNLV